MPDLDPTRFADFIISVDGLTDASSIPELVIEREERRAAGGRALAPAPWNPGLRPSCLVAEHCWDPVGLAIVEYAYRFERLQRSKPGGR